MAASTRNDRLRGSDEVRDDSEARKREDQARQAPA